MRFEYLHDVQANTTAVMMWKGSWLLSRKTVKGIIPIHDKPKIEKEMKDESNKG